MIDWLNEYSDEKYADYQDYLEKTQGDYEEYDPSYHGEVLGLTEGQYIDNQMLRRKYNDLQRPKYIGGTPEQARAEYYKRHPELIRDIKEISEDFGVPARIIANRLAHEGFVDRNIRRNNNYAYDLVDSVRSAASYKNRQFNPFINGDISFQLFGLDMVGNQIESGDIFIPEKYKDSFHIKDLAIPNEIGESGKLIEFDDNKTGIALIAARMASDLRKIRKDFPGIDDETAYSYLPVYYNRGGAKQYIQKRLNAGKPLGYTSNKGIDALFKRGGHIKRRF